MKTRRRSRRDSLWKWIQKNGDDKFSLTYAEIEKIAGLPIDHSFLTYKKELPEYGYHTDIGDKGGDK